MRKPTQLAIGYKQHVSNQKISSHAIFIFCMLSCTRLFGQDSLVHPIVHYPTDCKTPERIFALMAAPVVMKSTTTKTGTFYYEYMQINSSTKIFRNPPPGNIPLSCQNSFNMYVYYAATKEELENLPNIASTQGLAGISGVNYSPASVSFSDIGNVKKCRSQIKYLIRYIPPHSSGIFLQYLYPANSTVYYRWAKQIIYPQNIYPVTWSSILQFKVPANNTTPPAPCTRPDLVPIPLETDDILVFRGIGSIMLDEEGNTFEAVASSWCQGLSGPPAGNGQGSPVSTTITLPAINWGVKEINNQESGPFTCGLFREGESSPLATFTVNNLPANGLVMAPPFDGRGTKTVFMFPNSNACFIKISNAAGVNTNVEEKNFVIKIDRDHSITECNEANNNHTYDYRAGNAVVIPH